MMEPSGSCQVRPQPLAAPTHKLMLVEVHLLLKLNPNFVMFPIICLLLELLKPYYFLALFSSWFWFATIIKKKQGGKTGALRNPSDAQELVNTADHLASKYQIFPSGVGGN